jgi:site-specific recombinase XerD
MENPEQKPRRGRPRKHATLDDARAAERERVAAYRARKKADRDAAGADAPVRDVDLISAEDRQVLERFLANPVRALSLLTQEAYRGDLAGLAVFVRSGLLTATTEQINSWFNLNIRDESSTSETRPWTVRTAKRKQAALASFYGWCRNKELIDRNPMDLVTRRKYNKERPHRLDTSHIDRIFDLIEHKIATSDPRKAQLYILDAAIFRLCFNLALRVSEASGLRRSRIRYVTEKGRKELRVRVRRKGDRFDDYPLTDNVLSAYQRWMSVRDDCKIQPGSDDFVFIHPWFGKRVTRKRAWLRLRRVAAEAGVPAEEIRHFSPHKLRHTQAYDMAERGDAVHTIQSVLGHANISTTGIYIEDSEAARLQALRDTSRK